MLLELFPSMLPSHWDSQSTNLLYTTAAHVFNTCSRHTALFAVGEVVAQVHIARCTGLHPDDGGVSIEGVTIADHDSVTISDIVGKSYPADGLVSLTMKSPESEVAVVRSDCHC